MLVCVCLFIWSAVLAPALTQGEWNNEQFSVNTRKVVSLVNLSPDSEMDEKQKKCDKG